MGDNIGIGKVVAVFEAFVSKPKDVEAGFVAIDELVHFQAGPGPVLSLASVLEYNSRFFYVSPVAGKVAPSTGVLGKNPNANLRLEVEPAYSLGAGKLCVIRVQPACRAT